MKFVIVDPHGNRIEIDFPQFVNARPCLGPDCPFYRRTHGGCTTNRCIMGFPKTADPVREHEQEVEPCK